MNTCEGFACGVEFFNSPERVCLGLACTGADCCEAAGVCDASACGSGMQLKSGGPVCAGADCTEEECCAAAPQLKSVSLAYGDCMLVDGCLASP